jgi:hypothetical protein
MNAKTNIASADETLSDYEWLRLKKIQRNNAKLRSLGLITPQEEERANARCTESRRDANNKSGLESTPVRKNIRSNNPIMSSKNSVGRRSSAKGARSSLRLQGLPAPIGNASHEKTKHQCSESDLMQSTRDIKKPAPLTSQGVTSNRAATYEHCAMRIRTMSHAQLQQRIRVVERAAGRHCLIKLLIMVECFRDHELHDLAHMAESALQRLSEPQSGDER